MVIFVLKHFTLLTGHKVEVTSEFCKYDTQFSFAFGNICCQYGRT